MTGAFTVPVEGATLSGEHTGTNPGLILLHGFGGSRATWEPLMPLLSRKGGVLRYDLRGFGTSNMQDGAPFSHTDDLLRLMDARGIDRATIAGLSLGGAVASHFALDHPDRTAGLVLVSPGLVGWEWSDDWRALWRTISGAAREGDMARARDLWWNHPLFAPARSSEGAEELRRSIEEYHGHQWVSDPQREELPAVERLHEISAPTLLLTGERDLPDFRLIADLLEAAVPDIRREDFPSAGHMLPFERPAETAQSIARFVENL